MTKQRHNPGKPQNNYPEVCPRYENHKREDGSIYWRCEADPNVDVSKCKGNRHSCIKTGYHKIASQ